ncbi:MAG: DUF2007 domain-containing protein [Cytophagales bacterium]|nr:DUF2007 domain-containing protein [Cytophagales bacterium]
MKDWSVVYKTSMMSRAEIVKGVLTAHGLNAVIVNKKDSTLHMSHGLIEVQVPNSQVLNAMKIYNDEITFE